MSVISNPFCSRHQVESSAEHLRVPQQSTSHITKPMATKTTQSAQPSKLSANEQLLGTNPTKAREYNSVGFVRLNADLIGKICADPDATYEGRNNKFITVEIWIDAKEDGYATLVQTPKLKERLKNDGRYLPSVGVAFKSLYADKLASKD